MALSKQKDNLYDPFRGMWVSATPEEIVRQKLLQFMTIHLGFPKELLAVEKQLSELPHLKGISNLPKRRADILCFAKDIQSGSSMYPLLLIECKEGRLGKTAVDQVLGYNHFVRATYVAISGKNSIKLIYPQKLDFLPKYSELLEYACSN